MKKRKTIYLAGLAMTGMLALTGCKAKISNTQTETEQVIEEGDTKIFAPGEHVFAQRHISGKIGEKEYAEQLVVPEGYEIFTIYGINGTTSKDSFTMGFEVWFVNNETVEVEAAYNPKPGVKAYDYSVPGKVIYSLEEKETEKTLK